METQTFYQEIRKKTAGLWQAIFNHPFVTGIGKGNLPYDCYQFFLKQDYLYLIELSRLFALGTAKAVSLDEMAYFATLLKSTLDIEMELHRKTCSSFGISRMELEETEPAMITTAYTNLLMRTAYEGDFAEILAVQLPCAAGYVEIGQKLKAAGLPADKFYQDWIQTYSSQEFEAFVIWLTGHMNQLARGAEPGRKEKWFQLYLASTRFEYLFFDMSWKKELWPEGIR